MNVRSSFGTSPESSTRGSTDRLDANELLTQLDAVEDALREESNEGVLKPSRETNRLKKLIIQIPCYNEEQTLGITLEQLPRQVAGVDVVEWLVIDDGSTDRTVEVAESYGVDHIIRQTKNRGLARGFMTGLEEAVRQGADIIVNTDADNQYCAEDIERLIEPVVAGKADLVIGERPIQDTPHFSRLKKLLQRLGSWVVRRVSNTDVPDAPSGFRAVSRETARRLNVFSDYTYTLETIIQAGKKGMAVTSVPIRTNADLRPSRLLKSIPSYISRSASTIVRIFMTYCPFQFFAFPGAACCLLSLLICVRYLLFYFAGSGSGHVHSLLLGALLMGLGLGGIVIGLVADLISVNRKLLEKIDWRVQQLEELVQHSRRDVGGDN